MSTQFRLLSFSLTFLFAYVSLYTHTPPCLGNVNMKTTFFLATCLSLLHITFAATSPVFVGCYAPGLLDHVVANLLSGVANTLAFTNGATCAVSKKAPPCPEANGVNRPAAALWATNIRSITPVSPFSPSHFFPRATAPAPPPSALQVSRRTTSPTPRTVRDLLVKTPFFHSASFTPFTRSRGPSTTSPRPARSPSRAATTLSLSLEVLLPPPSPIQTPASPLARTGKSWPSPPLARAVPTPASAVRL